MTLIWMMAFVSIPLELQMISYFLTSYLLNTEDVMLLKANLNETEFNQFARIYDLQSLGITYTQRDVITLQNTMVVDNFLSTEFFDKEKEQLQYRLSLLIALKEKEEAYLLKNWEFLKNWDEDMQSQIIKWLVNNIYTYFGDSMKGPLTFEEIRTLFQKLNCFVVFNNLKLEPRLIELIREEYLDTNSTRPTQQSYLKNLISLYGGVQFPSRSEINRIFNLILKNLNKDSIDSEFCLLDCKQ